MHIDTAILKKIYSYHHYRIIYVEKDLANANGNFAQ